MKDKFSIYALRDLVCGINTKVPLVNGNYVTPINFDNAATTPPFDCVLKEIMDFAPWYASIHRGAGYKSNLSSQVFDKSRKIIADFVGCELDKNSIIFVKNTTEAINKLAFRLCSCDKKCIVLSTGMEHHSNDLPWRNKYHIEYIDTDDLGRLCLEDLEEKLSNYAGAVKLVTVTGASNATGYINPIHEIAKITHKYGAKILVDAAQLAPHKKIDMKTNTSDDHIDFLAFSAHKMYAPFGIGVLIGPNEIFSMGYPDYSGGGTVQVVTPDYVLWDTPPEKEEAGTPNLMGIIALISSIKMLNTIGLELIEKNELELTNYALNQLSSLKDIELYTTLDKNTPRVGIIPFNIKNMPHSITAKILSYDAGISVRNGCFCAQPYLQKILGITPSTILDFLSSNKLPTYGVVRASFGLYNMKEEVDILCNVLEYIVKNKDAYLQKYTPTVYDKEESPLTLNGYSNEYNPKK